MNLRFHPTVQRDINEVLDYYSEKSLTAADRFWDDLHARFHEIEENPHRFNLVQPVRGLRAARLRKFPYLILYYQDSRGVKITCVKHEKRRPLLGLFRR